MKRLWSTSLSWVMTPALVCGLLAPAATSSADEGAVAPASQPVVATQPTTSPASPLIAQLSSPDPLARRHAAVELLKFGESVRPELETLLKTSNDVDVITRVRGMISDLDVQRAIGPSLITLHVHDAPAREVAQAIGQQAFTKLQTAPENLWEEPIPRVTLDVDHEPFWVVMQKFSAQTGLNFQQFGEGLRLMRTGMRMPGLVVVRGPVIIYANNLSYSQNVQLGSGATNSDFTLQMMAMVEPKIVMLQGANPMEVKEAVDDAGNSLVSDLPGRRMFAFGGVGIWNLMARLNWPVHPGKRIKRIVISTSFLAQTKSDQFVVDDILKAHTMSRKLGSSELTFLDITRQGDIWRVRLRSSTNLPPDYSAERIQLLDSSGQAFEQRGSSISAGDHTDYTFMYGVGRHMDGTPSGDPSKFVWTIPLESKSVPVEFEFDDLPMPHF